MIGAVPALRRDDADRRALYAPHLCVCTHRPQHPLNEVGAESRILIVRFQMPESRVKDLPGTVTTAPRERETAAFEGVEPLVTRLFLQAGDVDLEKNVDVRRAVTDIGFIGPRPSRVQMCGGRMAAIAHPYGERLEWRVPQEASAQHAPERFGLALGAGGGV